MHIVPLGLGTGQKQILFALRQLQWLLTSTYKVKMRITAVPGVFDRGGSTKTFRDVEPTWPAMGDIAQCFEALHPEPLQLPYLGHRFTNAVLRGTSLRNAIVVAAFERHGPTQEAMDELQDRFYLHGRITPPTFTSCDLQATLGDGTFLRDQHEINEANILAHGDIDKIWITPEDVIINPACIEAILGAKVVIVCPGGTHEQILLIKEVVEALQKSPAIKICVTNLVNAVRRIHGHETIADHVHRLEKYLGEGFFDLVLYNTQSLSLEQAAAYEHEEKIALPPPHGGRSLRGRVVGADLLMSETAREIEGDPLRSLRSRARHDPIKLAHALLDIIEENILKSRILAPRRA